MVIATNDVAGSAQPPPRPEDARDRTRSSTADESGQEPGDKPAPTAVQARPATAERLPRWWVEILAIAALYGLYTGIRGLKSDDLGTADHTARRLLHLEQVWHLNPEHPLNNLLVHATALAVPACYFYATLHYILTPLVLAWMYRRQPAHYRRARSTILLTTVLGLVGFWLLPTTPPRLLPGAGFHDTMAQVSDWGWWGGDASAPRGLGGLTNQYAAMPSLHCAWALWCGFLIARHARRTAIRVLGACYPVLTTLVVMSTGNHYFLDAVGGIVDLLLAAGIVLLVGRLARRRPTPASGAGTDVSPPPKTPQPRPAQGLAAVAGPAAGRMPVGGHRLGWPAGPAPVGEPAPG